MNSGIVASLQIMVIGMAIVILFLIVMIYIMKLVSFIVVRIEKLLPQKEEEVIPTPVKTASNDKLLAAAIALAHIHSNKKQ